MNAPDDADPRPFALLVNPRAGAGRAARLLPAIERSLRARGARFERVETRGPGDGARCASDALAGGAAGVMVVGGDGTLSEATDGFFDGAGHPVSPGAWLAPLSAGTGGDFRRSIGATNLGRTEHGLDDAIGRVLAATPRPIDVGLLRYVDHEGRPAHRTFLNIASFGAAGLVDLLVSSAPKWIGGEAAFLLGTLRALARYRPQRVRLTLDDAPPRETTILNVAVANGRFFGGGMQVAPGAVLDDGAFDVVEIEAMPLAKAATLLPRFYRGTHIGETGVRCTRARRVLAEPATPEDAALLDVDGEPLGTLPATFEVCASALRLRG